MTGLLIYGLTEGIKNLMACPSSSWESSWIKFYRAHYPDKYFSNWVPLEQFYKKNTTKDMEII